MILIGGGNAWASSKTGTIAFNKNEGNVPISAASVEGNDNLGNSWTITTSGTTFFSALNGYCQVGSANNPASSITFTTTLPNEVNVTAMEAKFGGFSGTAGDVTLMVGDTSIGTGNLNGQSDVTVSSTSGTTGTVLTVTLTNISKGVKCYYISYTYTYEDDAATTTTIDASGITNTDVYNSPAAGSLSATVKDNNNVVISGATVTWSSSNTDVATIASDGTITLVAAGTTTITASYAGDDTYASSSDTYELTVTSSAPYVQPTSIEINLNNTIIPGLNAGSRITEETTTNIDNVSLTFNKTQSGSNYPQFDADLVRMYANTYVRLDAPSGYNIVKVEFTDTYSWNDVSTDVQTLDKSTRTWNGEATSVTFSFGAQCRPSKMVVTLETATVKVLSSIALSGDYPTTFTVGDTFSHEGMVVTATYEGGETEDVTSSAVFSSPDMTTTGEKTVTVSYTRGEVTKTAEYTITVNPVPVKTIAEVRTQGTGNVKTQGVVTSCVGVTAYIQDATAAICVYGEELTVGDDIIVEGTLSTYHGLLEIASPTITVLSQNNTTEPEVMTIAEINESTKQGWFVKIEDATVTAIDGDDTTIAQGENTITVHKITGVTLSVDDVISLTGNIGCYDNVQIANPTDVQVKETPRVKYYITGSFNSWSQTPATSENPNGMIELTKNSDGTYSTTMQNFAADFEIIKMDEDNTLTWFGGATAEPKYGIHNLWWKNIQMSSNNNDKKDFSISTAGDYTFTVNVTDMKLTVTGWKYYLEGDFNSWGTNNVFASSGDGVYTLTMQIDEATEIQVVAEAGESDIYYSNNYFSKDNCTNLDLYTGNNNMTIDAASEYVFTLTTDNNSIKLTVTGWPISVDGNMFVKVTSGDVEDGAYLIVYEDGNLAFDGSLATSTALSGSGNHIAVDIVNNAIVADATTKASLFYIQGSTIKSASGYYIGRTSDSNGMDVDDETVYTNTISIDNNGDAVINSSGNAYLRYNTQNSGMFRYYKSGTYTAQKAIQLYKLVTLPMNDIVITSAKWATYVPNLAVTIPEDVTAYIVTNATSTSVTLSSVASAPANTGLVVNGDEGTYTPTAAETTDDVSGNLLVVSDGTVVGNGNIYALGNKNGSVGFKKVKSGVTVPAGKPYLTIENTGSKDFFDFSFDEGVATGIESIESIGFDMNAPVYDLQGRQVNRLHKGIFIQNGKKIIVK